MKFMKCLKAAVFLIDDLNQQGWSGGYATKEFRNSKEAERLEFQKNKKTQCIRKVV